MRTPKISGRNWNWLHNHHQDATKQSPARLKSKIPGNNSASLPEVLCWNWQLKCRRMHLLPCLKVPLKHNGLGVSTCRYELFCHDENTSQPKRLRW